MMVMYRYQEDQHCLKVIFLECDRVFHQF